MEDNLKIYKAQKSQVDDCRATRLLLIFILLYFAFGSVKALNVYSMIPLSAVGGVLFLYMRGPPFSISVGVGFIFLLNRSIKRNRID
jgi:Cu/Ag efflux pump CusA